MKVTKYGHCCLLVEEKGVRILIDPGIFSSGQNDLTDIDAVLITHQHQDHLDTASLQIILKNSPAAKVVTNESVGRVLEAESIHYELIKHGETIAFRGVTIEALGNEHGQFHSTLPPIQNTGYAVAGRFFYPGDSVSFRGREFEILALPVAGPWTKMWEILDFALAMKPKVCFPVHEAILKDSAIAYRWPPQVLEPAGIPFQILESGKEYDF